MWEFTIVWRQIEVICGRTFFFFVGRLLCVCKMPVAGHKKSWFLKPPKTSWQSPHRPSSIQVEKPLLFVSALCVWKTTWSKNTSWFHFFFNFSKTIFYRQILMFNFSFFPKNKKVYNFCSKGQNGSVYQIDVYRA